MKSNLLCSFLILPLFVSAVFGGTYCGGNGSQEKPYKICDANSMNEIGANPGDWGSHFLLVNDINIAQFTGTEFNIIGTDSSNAFTGVFDGNNHTISNFTYSSTGGPIGLFGYVKGIDAEVKNLGLIDPNVIAAGEWMNVGSLVGYLDIGSVSSCYAEGGSVWSTEENVGGLVGVSTGTILDCHATCVVTGAGSTGYGDIGGLVGDNGTNAKIARCYATGFVQGPYDIGGLVGDNSPNTEISNCYATGSVYGNYNVGGLVGFNDSSNSTIFNSYATGLVQGSSDVGGLVGKNAGAINNSFFDIDTGGPDNSIGIPKTTKQMKTVSTFLDAGWDLVTIWNIEELQTYPLLRRYLAVDLNYDHRVNFVDLAKFVEYWLEGFE